MASRARILVVDDDAPMLTMTQRLLERAGYAVSTARTGGEGVALTQREQPDLLLLDVALPDASGFEICESLKTNPETSDVPVIMLSGMRVDALSRARGLEIGADDYVSRPVANRELLARVDAVLRLRQARATLQRQQQQLQALIDSSADGMLLVDAEGRGLLANPAACQLLRRGPAELIGEQIGLPITGEAPTDVDLLRPDGSTRTVELRARPLTWNEGPAWLATLRDVSDRRLTEALLRVRMRLVDYAAECSLPELLQRTLDELGELVDSPIGFYHFVEGDGTTVSLQVWSTQTLATFCQAEGAGLHYDIDEAGVWVDAVHQQAPVIHNDYASLPHRRGLPQGHAPIVRELVAPIMREGRVVAVLGVGNKPIPYTEDDLRIVNYLADVAWEIAERKRAELALQSSEARFRTMADFTYDWEYWLNADEACEYVSPSCERITGYSPGAFLGDPGLFSAIVHPEDREAFAQHERGRMHDPVEGDEHEMDFRIICQDGSVRWIAHSCRVVRGADGAHLGLRVSNRDITDRKAVEAERVALLAQVEAQIQRVRQIIEAIPQGVLLVDEMGQILVANPVATADLAILAPECGERLVTLGDRSLQTLLAPPSKGGWHEVKGGDRLFEALAREIPQPSGDAQWVVVINDVTHARGIQAQLRQQERLAAIGQLAAGIAHDFNNIMAVIVLYAQMVGAKQELTESSRRRVQVIQEQAYRATTLIGQILDFSRRAQLEQQPLQLLSLLKEVLKLWDRTLPDDISVSLDHDGSNSWIDADPTRIQQVLMNLATNARDAMPEGGRIEITLQEIVLPDDAPDTLPTPAAGAWVRLDFRDYGVGMSDEVQAHLFEPFFTTKPPGEGTGLGLAQIHGIVKQHGGDIDVTSALGEGTTVSIYLPALRPPDHANGMHAGSEATPQGAGERVLVVEDNVVTRDAIVETLEMLGYRVLQTTNGQEALAVYDAACAAGGEPIELIVSDLSMPEMGGKALVAALREEDRHTPVLILSGHIHDDEIAALEALDRVRCLRKPVDFNVLAEAVAALLG